MGEGRPYPHRPSRLAPASATPRHAAVGLRARGVAEWHAARWLNLWPVADLCARGPLELFGDAREAVLAFIGVDDYVESRATHTQGLTW